MLLSLQLMVLLSGFRRSVLRRRAQQRRAPPAVILLALCDKYVFSTPCGCLGETRWRFYCLSAPSLEWFFECALRASAAAAWFYYPSLWQQCAAHCGFWMI